ncbi:acyltransferase [Heliophilum fasciatum]|uniref:Acetyltransferase-like isoleucine patch superfamily enzyme n=1 Tax=Heliophilum fasciatum TaxID=35700 RepID=A0A4R2RFR7_9FIRM|nr:acyltransferase [Heliophilum fasciatum]MCW2279050.1 acetyltransferase-like isoleucine patch superfamily enzyme [Heliophilum fasciatum]TCP61514.1 acetyltransferase-like isoleucine patch superfamily enzyme [Heliophilum fasciatum]
MARRTTIYPVEEKNSLHYVYEHVPYWRVFKNFIVIWLSRYTPFLRLKNLFYRRFLGMQVGKDTSVALMVMVDILYPERIRIGEDCVIGYNTTILAHEYLLREYRVGDVVIGDRVVIGANCTLLPGIEIGERAVIAAGSVVTADVPANTLVGGVPARVIRTPYYRQGDGEEAVHGRSPGAAEACRVR